MAIIDARGNAFDPINQFLMAQLQRQQLQADLDLRQQELDLRKQAFNLDRQETETRMQREAEVAQGQGAGAQAQLAIMAANDPQIQQIIQQQQPQTIIGQQGEAGNFQMPTGSLPQSMAGGQAFRPFDASRVPGNVAAGMVTPLQTGQLTAAELRERGARTSQIEQEVDQGAALFEDRQNLLRAQIAAQEADTDESRAAIRNADRQYRMNLRAQAAQLSENQHAIFAELRQVLGSPAEAARVAFGSNAPVSRQATLEENMRFLDAAALQAQNGEEYASLLGSRRRMQVAERINLLPVHQTAADAAWEQTGGDANAAFRLADEELDDAVLSQVYVYYRAAYDAEIERPQKRSFWDAFRRIMSSAGTPVGASPVAPSQRP